MASSYERFGVEQMKHSCFTSTQNVGFREIIEKARGSENTYCHSPISSCMKSGKNTKAMINHVRKTPPNLF